MSNLESTIRDDKGNEIKSNLSDKINRVEIDMIKELSDIKNILTRIEGNLKQETDTSKDHEKRIRFLEKGYWIGLTILTAIILFKDSILNALK